MSEGTAATPPGTPSQPAQLSHRPAASAPAPATLVPETGWHFLHVFYRIDRDVMADMTSTDVERGRRALTDALTRRDHGSPEQLQCFAIPGHKADFGFMAAGPDLKAVHAIETAIQASPLGPALVPTYSFYSITEVSEYVPNVAQYGEILKRENVDPESPTFKTKVAAYEQRLGPMNKQRLYPEFPDWPCFCFYPMSKMRQGEQNWYLLPFETRAELMSQHGKSGMTFAGKVTQVITASTGLDDWEWGVTLWARNPAYLKDIVYTMRFDESSAKYALFGPFYFGYLLTPAELLGAIRL
jgi:peroxiredoxin